MTIQITLKYGEDDGVKLLTPFFKGGWGDPNFGVRSNLDFEEDTKQGCTAAQLEPGLKNKLSHRGQALSKLVRLMKTRSPFEGALCHLRANG